MRICLLPGLNRKERADEAVEAEDLRSRSEEGKTLFFFSESNTKEGVFEARLVLCFSGVEVAEEGATLSAEEDTHTGSVCMCFFLEREEAVSC
jgi:hypothetical protein